jgi:hypothetical protein
MAGAKLIVIYPRPRDTESFDILEKSVSLGTGLLERRPADCYRHKLRSGGQILFHAADAMGISLSQRFPGLDCLNMGFVVDEGTPSCVKSFPHPPKRPPTYLGARQHQAVQVLNAALDGGRPKIQPPRSCRRPALPRRRRPSIRESFGTRHIFFQSPAQTVAEPQRHFEHPFVAVQLNHIAVPSSTAEQCFQPRRWSSMAARRLVSTSPSR